MNYLEVCIRYMRGAKSIKDWNYRRAVVKQKVLPYGVKYWRAIAFEIDARGLIKDVKIVNGWR